MDSERGSGLWIWVPLLTPPYSEQRRDARAALALEVFDKHGGNRAVTRDISRRGLFIQTAQPPSVGTRFVLNFTVPDCEVPLEVSAEVVRRERTGMAVTFVFAGEAQRAFVEGQLERLVQHHQH